MAVGIMKDGDKWVLVRNPGLTKRGIGGGRTGQGHAPARTHDGYWTGDAWRGQRKDQLRFDAPEDAESYANENFPNDQILIV